MSERFARTRTPLLIQYYGNPISSTITEHNTDANKRTGVPGGRRGKGEV